ncbi:MAG: glycosyltransferase [Ruminococcaceae bacterium]|nr:glycosyltransferase [Oscillospiraceae bacterium]
MKILMVNKFLYSRGGCENYMLYLAEHLTKLGHEIEFFGMYDENNTVGNSVGLYTQNMDFHSKGVARFLYPFKIIYSFEAKKKIMQVIDDFQPDIVHMNNINFQLTPSMIYGIKKKGIPVVQTVHDYQMICPNHLLYNFDKNEICEKCLKGAYMGCIKNKCIHDSRVKSIIGAIEARLYSLLGTYKKVDLYISPSYFLEQKLLSAKKLYKGKTKTIHNFINKEQFSCQESNYENYIAFAGRLSKEKGVELLAETAKLLPEYTFMVAGDGPDKHLLENIENVKLVGFLSGQKLIDFIAKAKVLAVPSIWYENCPLSILEAQCMGVPVITMNHGGMAELIEDGVTGILVKESTPQEFAAGLQRALASDEYCNSLRENCKNAREQILSVEEYAKILMEEYKKLMKR